MTAPSTDGGTFTIARGKALDTNDGTLSITANKMAVVGTLDAGAARTSPICTNTGAFDLGSTTDAANNTVELSPAEFGRMTAGVLQIGETPTGASATTLLAQAHLARICRRHVACGHPILDARRGFLADYS